MEDTLLDFRLGFQETASKEIAAMEDQFQSASSRMELAVDQIAISIERMDGMAAVTREAIHALQSDLGGMGGAAEKATASLTRSIADARRAIESSPDAAGALIANQVPRDMIELDATEASRQLEQRLSQMAIETPLPALDLKAEIADPQSFATAVRQGFELAIPALTKALGRKMAVPERLRGDGAFDSKSLTDSFESAIMGAEKGKKQADFLGGGVGKDMKAGGPNLAQALGSVIDKITAPFQSFKGILALFGLLTIFTRILEPFMRIMADFLAIITTPLRQGMTRIAQELAPVMAILAKGMANLVRQLLPPLIRLMQEGVIPVLMALITALEPVAKWFIESISWLAEWFMLALQGKKGIEALYGAIAVLLLPIALALAAAISALWSVVAGFFAFLFANPIGLIAIAIVGLIFLLKEWAGGWGNLWEVTKEVAGGIWDVISGLAKAIASVAMGIFNVLTSIFSTLWTIVGGTIGMIMDLWSNTIGRVVGYFVPELKAAVDAARSYLPGGGKTVKLEVVSPKSPSITEAAEAQEKKAASKGWFGDFLGEAQKGKTTEQIIAEKERGAEPAPPKLVAQPIFPMTEPESQSSRTRGDVDAVAQARAIAHASRPVMDALETIDRHMQGIAKAMIRTRAEARLPQLMARLAAFEA